MYKTGIILVVLLIITALVIIVYNKMVKNRNLVQEAWSGIDVFLKKRHDLAPNLVEVVKGYAAYEKTVLEDITRCRSAAMQAKDTEAQVVSENSLGKALDKLLAVVENYPDLKANANFLKLQQQLTDLENDLEAARRYYNGTVRINNTYMESFPLNLIAGMFNFRKGVFFAADPSAKEVPKISG